MKSPLRIIIAMIVVSIPFILLAQQTKPSIPQATPVVSWAQRTYTDTIVDSVYVTCPNTCKISFPNSVTFFRSSGWVVFKITAVPGTATVTIKDTLP